MYFFLGILHFEPSTLPWARNAHSYIQGGSITSNGFTGLHSKARISQDGEYVASTSDTGVYVSQVTSNEFLIDLLSFFSFFSVHLLTAQARRPELPSVHLPHPCVSSVHFYLSEPALLSSSSEDIIAWAI
jgi:hypothetical protein